MNYKSLETFPRNKRAKIDWFRNVAFKYDSNFWRSEEREESIETEWGIEFHSSQIAWK